MKSGGGGGGGGTLGDYVSQNLPMHKRKQHLDRLQIEKVYVRYSNAPSGAGTWRRCFYPSRQKVRNIGWW